jgi:hypothetical protein
MPCEAEQIKEQSLPSSVEADFLPRNQTTNTQQHATATTKDNKDNKRQQKTTKDNNNKTQ